MMLHVRKFSYLMAGLHRTGPPLQRPTHTTAPDHTHYNQINSNELNSYTPTETENQLMIPCQQSNKQRAKPSKMQMPIILQHHPPPFSSPLSSENLPFLSLCSSLLSLEPPE